jgi:hypothetical protein
VYGVGNVANVTVKYELYRKGPTGDILIDTGTRSTSQALDEFGKVVKDGLTLTDNLAHNISLFDDGSAGGGDSSAGDYFDYALISFVFPTTSANQGIRVGTFFTEIINLPEADSITFDLQTTDADGDVGFSGPINMKFDAAILPSDLSIVGFNSHNDGSLVLF